MSEFCDLEKKAEAYAEEHPEQADMGIDEAAGIAERDAPMRLQVDSCMRRALALAPGWPASAAACRSASALISPPSMTAIPVR